MFFWGTATQVGAEIYKYIDETGRVTYSIILKEGAIDLATGIKMDEERFRIANEREKERKRIASEKAKKPGVAIGMTAKQVRDKTHWGAPDSINATLSGNVISEQWVYGHDYLYFTNGKLTTIQRSNLH